jgi:hypothetical protein
MRNSCASAAPLLRIRASMSGEAKQPALGRPAHGHAGDAGEPLAIELQRLMAIKDGGLDVRREEREFYKNGEIALVEAHGFRRRRDRFRCGEMLPCLMSASNAWLVALPLGEVTPVVLPNLS